MGANRWSSWCSHPDCPEDYLFILAAPDDECPTCLRPFTAEGPGAILEPGPCSGCGRRSSGDLCGACEGVHSVGLAPTHYPTRLGNELMGAQ